jgi:hypothetical protein
MVDLPREWGEDMDLTAKGNMAMRMGKRAVSLFGVSAHRPGLYPK